MTNAEEYAEAYRAYVESLERKGAGRVSSSVLSGARETLYELELRVMNEAEEQKRRQWELWDKLDKESKKHGEQFCKEDGLRYDPSHW